MSSSSSSSSEGDYEDADDEQPIVINVSRRDVRASRAGGGGGVTSRSTTPEPATSVGAAPRFSLREFGYTRVASMPEADRRASLVAAVRSCMDMARIMGILEWSARMNARRNPAAAATFEADLEWLRRNRDAFERYLFAPAVVTT